MCLISKKTLLAHVSGNINCFSTISGLRNKSILNELHKVVEVSDKPITVYKCLTLTKKDKWITPYRNTLVFEDYNPREPYIMSADHDSYGAFGIESHIYHPDLFLQKSTPVRNKHKSKVSFKIYWGIHAYTKKPKYIKLHSALFKAIIPPGTAYIVGDEDDIVAETLIIYPEIIKHFKF